MTIAFRPQNQSTTYVRLNEKQQKENAARIANSSGGDSKTLSMTPEAKREFVKQAEHEANKPLQKLDPQEVWADTRRKIAGMRASTFDALRAKLPPAMQANFHSVAPADQMIHSVGNTAHSGLTPFAVLYGKGGKELQFYLTNSDGAVTIKNGKPELVARPATEQTQNTARVFATLAQRMPDNTRRVSPDLIVQSESDMTKVANRLREVFGQPALDVVKPKPMSSFESHARSLWSRSNNDHTRDVTVSNKTAAPSGARYSEPQPRQAFAM